MSQLRPTLVKVIEIVELAAADTVEQSALRTIGRRIDLLRAVVLLGVFLLRVEDVLDPVKEVWLRGALEELHVFKIPSNHISVVNIACDLALIESVEVAAQQFFVLAARKSARAEGH